MFDLFMNSGMGDAIIFNGPKLPLEKKEFPLYDDIGDDDAVVEITLSTVCGSDVHTWLGHRPFPTPCILGHEMVGKIISIGKNLTVDYNGEGLSIGDKVVWSMTVGCGKCFFCEKKLPQKCTKMFKYGHVKSDQKPHFTGGFAKYIHLKKGSYIFKVSPELSDEEVAPLMCAASTITSGLDYGDFQDCDYVIIQGCGALGMYACAFTKQLGAKKVIAIDVIADRLELAKQFGADYIINAKEIGENLTDEIMKITENRGADFVIEITGEPSVINQGIKMIRIGGTYILLGAIYPNNHVTLDSSDIITKCLKIVGMHNYNPEHLKTALELVLKTKDKYPYKKLVGPSFEFSAKGLEDAFKALDSKQSLRPAINPN
jgi:alcohol dehydrogenase